jgi:hypothetical protein
MGASERDAVLLQSVILKVRTAFPIGNSAHLYNTDEKEIHTDPPCPNFNPFYLAVERDSPF